jgi:hypothetical protein
MMDRLQAVIPRQLKSADDNNNSGNGNQQLLSVDAYRQFWSDLTIVMDELVAKLQKIIPRSALCRQLTRLLECAVQSVLLTVLSPVLSTGRQQRQQHHNQQSFSNTLNNRRDKNQMFQFLDVLTLCIQQWSRLLDLISESSEQSTGSPIGKGTRRKLTLTIFGELHAEYIELEIQGFRTALADIPIHPKTIASANILMELINNENDIMTKIRFYFMVFE